MNDLFQHMQDQLSPSAETLETLKQTLDTQSSKKYPSPSRWYYGLAAACAVLAILAVPIYQSNSGTNDLHSYVLAERDLPLDQHTSIEYEAQDKGGAIAERIPKSPPDYDPAVQDGIIEAPVQEEAAMAYEKLMAHFGDSLPDWYGGAYLDDNGMLTVLLAEKFDPGDKSLESDILKWTGNGPVIFGSAKYSLNQLNHQMDQLNHLVNTDPKFRAAVAVCGTDERNNRIFLYLTQADEQVLSQLARLDPEDDMIYVEVGIHSSAVDVPVSDSEQPASDGDPAGYSPIEEPIAIEPVIEDLPEQRHDLAHYDVLPEVVGGGDTGSSAPAQA